MISDDDAGERAGCSGSCGGGDDERSRLRVRARNNIDHRIAAHVFDRSSNLSFKRLCCWLNTQEVDGGVDESGEDAGAGDRHGDVHQDLGLHGGSAAGRHCWIRSLPCTQVMDE